MGSRLEKNSNAVQKAIENHEFTNEQGDEYEPSKFGGFPEYFRRKKIKLQNRDVDIRAQSRDNPQIFKGIVVHVNGYTQPSLNDIHTLVVSHGGGFIQYLDGKTQVTHIIASNLTPKKAEEFKRYRIVKPAWIVDSVAAAKQLPWHAYRLVDEGVSQKIINFQNGSVTSQLNHTQRGYRYQTDTSWYTKQLSGTDQASEATQLPTPDVSTSSNIDKSSTIDLSPESPNLPTDPEPRNDFQLELSNADGGEALSFQQDDDLYDADLVEAVASISEPADGVSEAYEKDQSGGFGAAQEDPVNTSLKRELTSPSKTSPAKKAKLTAEEHNSLLLSDPRVRKSSVLNPEFLEQYYRESRLHHLSFWRADLKSQIQAMTAAQSSSQRARQKRAPGARRYILHIDFDSFFVTVSLKNYPQYVDIPAVVAHGAGNNSEIASCNYPARKFGLKNGMWMKKAHELCKDIKILPYDFPAYEAASKVFYDAVLATDGVVQSISVDEALVDVTVPCLRAGGTDGTTTDLEAIKLEQAEANQISEQIRDRVKQESGCDVSVGIGGNILLAKTALRKAKPAGQYHVKPEEVLDFLSELSVRDLPGVAYSIGGKLEEEGIKLIKDIRNVTKERLITILGPKTGEKIWNYSKGVDKTEVGDPAERKSVSAEVNWGVRFETSEQAEEFIESLCRELHNRLVRERVKGKQLTMKILRRAADAPLDPPKHLGHGKCDTFTKSVALGVATNDPAALTKEALAILRFHGFPPGELRGLGVQMTKLEPLKGALEKPVDGSQKRLLFKPRDPAELVMKPTLEKSDEQGAAPSYSSNQKRLQFKAEPTRQTSDPIQDNIETPKKQRISDFLGGMPESDSPSRRPLNTLGTQFVFPSQIDPSVVAELPEDIRSKLETHMRQQHENEETTEQESRGLQEGDNVKPFYPSTVLPSQSQLDPEILGQLPDDVRSEILAHYSTTSNRPAGQARLPQSPRKDRALQNSHKIGRPRGRPRGSTNSVLSRLKGTNTSRSSTLTQTNFVARNPNQDTNLGTDINHEDTSNNEISEDFLAALPEDLRKEVLEQHRAEQLKRNGGLEMFARRGGKAARAGRDGENKQQRVGGADGQGMIVSGDRALHLGGEQNERFLVLPKQAERPGFTARKLSRIEDLREAVSLWIEEFLEEGPYKEDVEALGKYLKNVVCEERDMNKAITVVKWMAWITSNRANAAEQDKDVAAKWAEALERTKQWVRDAVQSRGLGVVEF